MTCRSSVCLPTPPYNWGRVTLPKQPWPVLVAGTITRDDVRTPMGVNTDGLGGSATYFTLAARLFAPVSVVATAGPDFMPAFQEAMRATGADLRSVVQSALPTYRWRAEHDYTTGTTRNETSDQGAYRGFTPVLTGDQRKAKIVFLGSMEPRHQMRVLEQLEGPWLVAGDTMKLYIREEPEALEPVLQRLDYLFLNASEAMALAKVDARGKSRDPDTRGKSRDPDTRGKSRDPDTRGKSRDPDNIDDVAALLRGRYRLRGLVIKEGPKGATLYRHGDDIHLPALPVDPPTDPTGAGDAVAAGFLGALAEQQVETDESVRLALGYAMVMASFTIQHFSVKGLQPITRADVEARMASMAWQVQPTG